MQGYVYLLMNPSYTGMLKIGKTTKQPEERVRELSSATGVPTPFVLLYSIRVSDCDYVEKSIHRELEHLGFRNSTNREFFNIDVQSAIRTFQRYEESFEETWEDSNDFSEEEQSSLLDFLHKNGSKCLAARPILESGLQELRVNKKIALLEKALELKSIQAGIELSLNMASSIKSDTKRLDYTLETYQLIKAIPDDEEYFNQMFLYYTPKIPELLVEAMTLAHTLHEYELMKKLAGIFYDETKLVLNHIILPNYLYVIQESKKMNNNEVNVSLCSYSLMINAKEFTKKVLEIEEYINVHDEEDCLKNLDSASYELFNNLSDMYMSLSILTGAWIKIHFEYFIPYQYPVDMIKYLFNKETEDIVSIFKEYFDVIISSSNYYKIDDDMEIKNQIERYKNVSTLCADYLEKNFQMT